MSDKMDLNLTEIKRDIDQYTFSELVDWIKQKYPQMRVEARIKQELKIDEKEYYDLFFENKSLSEEQRKKLYEILQYEKPFSKLVNEIEQKYPKINAERLIMKTLEINKDEYDSFYNEDKSLSEIQRKKLDVIMQFERSFKGIINRIKFENPTLTDEEIAGICNLPIEKYYSVLDSDTPLIAIGFNAQTIRKICNEAKITLDLALGIKNADEYDNKFINKFILKLEPEPEQGQEQEQVPEAQPDDNNYGSKESWDRTAARGGVAAVAAVTALGTALGYNINQKGIEYRKDKEQSIKTEVYEVETPFVAKDIESGIEYMLDPGQLLTTMYTQDYMGVNGIMYCKYIDELDNIHNIQIVSPEYSLNHVGTLNDEEIGNGLVRAKLRDGIGQVVVEDGSGNQIVIKEKIHFYVRLPQNKNGTYNAVYLDAKGRMSKVKVNSLDIALIPGNITRKDTGILKLGIVNPKIEDKSVIIMKDLGTKDSDVTFSTYKKFDKDKDKIER